MTVRLRLLRDVPQAVSAVSKGTGVYLYSHWHAFACNVANNLPVGLLTGSAIQNMHLDPSIRDALAIGIDLGPNLSVTGSLATLLWLPWAGTHRFLPRDGSAPRGRERQPGTFLKIGLLVTPPALLIAGFSSPLAAEVFLRGVPRLETECIVRL